MELIDREKLKKILCDQCAEIAGICQRGSCGLTRMLDSMPVVDAVPVVRCKDCIHYDDLNNGEASCFISGYPLEDPNGFCSAGTNTIS